VVGVTLYRPSPGMLDCRAFIERWNQTVRVELLNYRLIFGKRDLRRLLKDCVEYFNQNRQHQSLEQDSPFKKHGHIGFVR
jgi:transposase InsO family protein